MKAIAQIQAKVPTKMDQREVVTDKGHRRAKSRKTPRVVVWVQKCSQ